MPQVEKLKIFLASPSDVATERNYVVEVVEEVNRTIGAHKNVVLEVVRSEKNVFPGYGKDGQAILNEQIGKMQEYELFVGIMWNRIGTKTPRAASGTVEEFGRAVAVLKRRAKPQVWFYFRQSPANFTTKAELQQKEEVLAFREKFQRAKGLFRDYKSPSDFRNQFREQLTLWLQQRKETKSSIVRTKRQKQQAEQPAVRKPKATPSSQTRSTKLSSATTATNKPAVVQKTPKSNSKQGIQSVKKPGDLVLLGERFMQAKSISTQSDQSVVLQVLPSSMEEISNIQALQSRDSFSKKQIVYTDQHRTEIMQVSSVNSEMTSNKTKFSITLTPVQKTHNSGFGMEVNYQNYSADEFAELRARLLLLGEPLPKEIARLATSISIPTPNNRGNTVEAGIFPALWASLQTQQKLFLPRAWLWAAYHLKMSQIVGDILELELGPIRNKVMSVKFRGRRRQLYVNQESSIIKVVGSCSLKSD
jgi:dsDNA-binding SOS-regulon protein